MKYFPHEKNPLYYTVLTIKMFSISSKSLKDLQTFSTLFESYCMLGLYYDDMWIT